MPTVFHPDDFYDLDSICIKANINRFGFGLSYELSALKSAIERCSDLTGEEKSDLRDVYTYWNKTCWSRNIFFACSVGASFLGVPILLAIISGLYVLYTAHRANKQIVEHLTKRYTSKGYDKKQQALLVIQELDKSQTPKKRKLYLKEQFSHFEQTLSWEERQTYSRLGEAEKLSFFTFNCATTAFEKNQIDEDQYEDYKKAFREKLRAAKSSRTRSSYTAKFCFGVTLFFGGLTGISALLVDVLRLVPWLHLTTSSVLLLGLVTLAMAFISIYFYKKIISYQKAKMDIEELLNQIDETPNITASESGLGQVAPMMNIIDGAGVGSTDDNESEFQISSSGDNLNNIQVAQTAERSITPVADMASAVLQGSYLAILKVFSSTIAKLDIQDGQSIRFQKCPGVVFKRLGNIIIVEMDTKVFVNTDSDVIGVLKEAVNTAMQPSSVLGFMSGSVSEASIATHPDDLTNNSIRPGSLSPARK